MTFESILK